WRFIAAGGDIVLTVDPAQAAAMTGAIRSWMRSNPTFRQKVYAAVRRVLTVKQAHGLLPEPALLGARRRVRAGSSR
ncbi:MAG: hypothetical protein ABI808_15205, partial [Pseudonocardiales bacterium]